MCRYDGVAVSQASVLRLLRDEGLLLEANSKRERRQNAARRKAAFAASPTGRNQMWQLDFSEFETATGGTWRLAGCRDYWSKYGKLVERPNDHHQLEEWRPPRWCATGPVMGEASCEAATA